MAGYLLDTNHLAKAVVVGSAVRQRVAELRKRGVRVGTCVPVLCEIEVGIQQVSRPVEYRIQLAQVLGQVRLWPLEPETAQEYGIIHRELKARGRFLSQVDMMLAALARQMKLVVVTTDKDFAGLPDIRTDNWLN
jgi:tRNA(fMet)-specific endonuclease VapC